MSDKIVDNLLVSVLLLVLVLTGFGLSCGWWKFAGRDLDRTTLSFLGKLWGGMFVVEVAAVFLMHP